MNSLSNKEVIKRARERRKYPRLQPKRKVFSSLKYNGEYIVGNVIDISRGGLSFKYLFNMHQIFLNGNSDTYEVEIFSPDKDIFIQGVKCKVVYTRILPNGPVSFLKIVKCGLKFKSSDYEIVKNIDELISKTIN